MFLYVLFISLRVSSSFFCSFFSPPAKSLKHQSRFVQPNVSFRINTVHGWINKSAPFNTSIIVFPVKRMNVHICEWIYIRAQPFFSLSLSIARLPTQLIINMYLRYIFGIDVTGARLTFAAQMIEINIFTAAFCAILHGM